MNHNALHADILAFFWAEWRLHFGDLDPQQYNPGEATNSIVRQIRVSGSLTEDQLQVLYGATASFAEQVTLLYPEEATFMTAYLVEAIEREKPSVVVDAGCGVALQLAYLARKFPDVCFYGYDLSAPTLVRARERLERLGCTNAEILLGRHATITDVVGQEVADIIYTKHAHMDPCHLAGVSSTLRHGGLFIHLQDVAESFHADLVTRGHLFRLVEEVRGRSSVPESKQEQKARWDAFSRGIPTKDADKLADTLAFRKGHTLFFAP